MFKRLMWVMVPIALAAGVAAQTVAVDGNPRAKLRVLIYESLQCKDSAAFRVALDEYLLPRYGSQVAFEHHDFIPSKHKWARKAAMAARYFDSVRPEAGLSWRRYVHGHLAELNDSVLEERVREFAREESLDAAAAVRALSSTAFEDAVQRDQESGAARGVTKTPTVIVGEKVFAEKVRPSEVAAAIEAALKP